MLFLSKNGRIFCIFLWDRGVNNPSRAKKPFFVCAPVRIECPCKTDTRRWVDDFCKLAADKRPRNFRVCHNCFSETILLK